jgi:hypothetical protein
MVNEVIHANGVTDAQANDPDAMRRPLSVVAKNAANVNLWNTPGNLKAIGTSSFLYDKVSRMVSATLFDGTGGGGNQKAQTYIFDPFGNLQAISGDNGRNTPTNSATNRLTGLGVQYDAAGNLTSWSGATYEHDAFDQMWHMKSGAEEWFYSYTADDERVWSFKPAVGEGKISQELVEAAISRQIAGEAGRVSYAGAFWGKVAVEGRVITYRAFTLSDGTINVGTYYLTR